MVFDSEVYLFREEEGDPFDLLNINERFSFVVDIQ